MITILDVLSMMFCCTFPEDAFYEQFIKTLLDVNDVPVTPGREHCDESWTSQMSGCCAILLKNASSHNPQPSAPSIKVQNVLTCSVTGAGNIFEKINMCITNCPPRRSAFVSVRLPSVPVAPKPAPVTASLSSVGNVRPLGKGCGLGFSMGLSVVCEWGQLRKASGVTTRHLIFPWPH
uniref:Uncharacterized protein n=1 Tax=Denticeps clupeoides TaxID=299321 RepID=A0AAY4B5M3_9TELE